MHNCNEQIMPNNIKTYGKRFDQLCRRPRGAFINPSMMLLAMEELRVYSKLNYGDGCVVPECTTAQLGQWLQAEGTGYLAVSL
jgi:hypothetical protein